MFLNSINGADVFFFHTILALYGEDMVVVSGSFFLILFFLNVFTETGVLHRLRQISFFLLFGIAACSYFIQRR